MKNLKLEVVVILSLLLLNLSQLSGQQDSCYIEPTALAGTFTLPEILNVPPINQYMPFDCMVGYILMDTLAKSMPDSTLLKIPFNISIDSLLVALRYKYSIQDFSPSLVRSYIKYAENLVSNQYYQSYPASTFFTLNRVVEQRINEIGYAYSLLYLSDYVLRIKVKCIDNIIDSVTVLQGPWTNIQADVISILKGQNLPENCHISQMLNFGITNTVINLDDLPQQCLRFGYIPRRLTNTGFKEFTTLNGGSDELQDMTKDKEYIVFLRHIALNYNTDFLMPFHEIGKNGGIFEINEDNKVIDIDNIFGLGNNPDADEFIIRVNSLIYNIQTAWVH